VFGQVDGDLRASECIVIHKDAVVKGDVITSRIVVEDGAYVHARIQKLPAAE
jgi:cytoskeletal protein CcmA (bactofilin family)